MRRPFWVMEKENGADEEAHAGKVDIKAQRIRATF